MEEFDISKIVPIVIFAALYLFLQWKSRNGAPKGVGDEGAEILEEFDFEAFEREAQSSSDTQRSRVESRASAPSTRVSPRVEESVTSDESKDGSKMEFDLRKAVIMSEILTPKFKDE